MAYGLNGNQLNCYNGIVLNCKTELQLTSSCPTMGHSQQLLNSSQLQLKSLRLLPSIKEQYWHSWYYSEILTGPQDRLVGPSSRS